MKARTKAAKRRGRPRKEYVARTDSGRISRVKEQPSQLALEARARMHKLTIEQARDQQAGTFLGRLHMEYLRWKKRKDDTPQPEQSISTAQYYALLQYQTLHNDWRKAQGVPGAYFEPRLGGTGDEEAHARWSRSVTNACERARQAIMDAQAHDRTNNLWAALDLCVIQEQYLPYMVGTLRTLGNVLARHFQRG